MQHVMGEVTSDSRGKVEARGDSRRIRVYAGLDPVGGKPVYLRETVCGTDDALLWKSEEHDSLADANDSGELTFPDIAELVRRHPSLVFED